MFFQVVCVTIPVFHVILGESFSFCLSSLSNMFEMCVTYMRKYIIIIMIKWYVFAVAVSCYIPKYELIGRYSFLIWYSWFYWMVYKYTF